MRVFKGRDCEMCGKATEVAKFTRASALWSIARHDYVYTPLCSEKCLKRYRGEL